MDSEREKMDNINFKSRTVLITSPQRYAERLQTISHDKAMLAYNTRLKHGVAKKCEINDGDIFVLVHNGNDGQIRRIEYDYQMGAKKVIDNICEDIENFSKGIKENITCMIMGGRSRDSVSTKCVNDIANRVEGYLANNNQKGDVSLICGLTDSVKSPIFVDYSRQLKTPEIYIPAETEGNVSAEKLEDVFDIVELNNVDLIGY